MDNYRAQNWILHYCWLPQNTYQAIFETVKLFYQTGLSGSKHFYSKRPSCYKLRWNLKRLYLSKGQHTLNFFAQNIAIKRYLMNLRHRFLLTNQGKLLKGLTKPWLEFCSELTLLGRWTPWLKIIFYLFIAILCAKILSSV
jgi:hypothetical protein